MEYTKVLRNRKIMGILAGLLIFQLFFYIYSIQTKEDTYYPNNNQTVFHSQEELEEAFFTSVEGVIAQADAMGGISIFVEKDSFSNSNLQQTKKDYIGLLDVKPILFEDEYLEFFFEFQMINWITLLAGIIIAVVLIDEKKRGISNIIFSCVNGRGTLVVHKIGALLLWAGTICLIFYGSTWITSATLYRQNPFTCLSYPLQSIMLFFDMPWQINIGAFLLWYLFCKVVTVFLVMLVVWTILFSINNVLLASGMISATGILMYVIDILIPNNHPLNVLHYCNLWYQFFGNDYFTVYKNLNIFSYAVNKEIVILMGWILLAVIVLTIAFLVGRYKYPNASSNIQWLFRLKKYIKAIQRKYRCLQEKLSILGIEFYKALISQKGILIILVVIYVLYQNTDYTDVLTTGAQEMYHDFIDKYEGIPSIEAQEELEALTVQLEELEQGYIVASEAYANGEMEADEYWEWKTKYEMFERDRFFLRNIKAQTEYLAQLKSQGIEGWYINIYCYNHLLNRGDEFVNVIIIFAVILIGSGIFSLENRTGMTQILCSSMKGRRCLFQKKMIVIVSITLMLFMIATFFEISSVAQVYGISGLNAPVQSIPLLSFVTFPCSIGVFLSLLYVLKGSMLCIVALFTSMISIYVSQKVTVGVSFVLCIPELLILMGLWFFQYVSIIRVLSIAPFLLGARNVWFLLIVFGIFAFIGITSLRWGYKKWCNA